MLKGRGADRCGPCPVCGGTDRFSINIRKQVFRCRVCNIGGDVIAALGVKPGPIVGEVLRRLLERVLDDASLNQRERLLALVPEVAQQIQ